MAQKTESQIMQGWTNKDDFPLVSIICTTYNQETYIRDAIEGFLSQETYFPFEIIVHDDASTDLTSEILKKYVKEYPRLIKPIFQKENQYSQEINIFLIAVSHTRGDYIAVCEGDDYWTDPKKLQIQIDEMKKYPQCEISFHPSLYQYPDEAKRTEIISRHSSYNKIFTINEVILGGGSFCPTASLIVKRNVFFSLLKGFQNGDYFIQILGALHGGALYINRVMSIYRVGVPGSWSERIIKDKEYAYSCYIKILELLDNIDAHTEYKYHIEFNTIRKKICFWGCQNLVFSLEKRNFFFLQCQDKLTWMEKASWYLIYKNDWIFHWKRQIRKSLFSFFYFIYKRLRSYRL